MTSPEVDFKGLGRSNLAIGLDLGSSSTKAILWDCRQQQLLAKSQVFIQTKRFQKDGLSFIEHDPEEIFQSVIEAVGRVTKNLAQQDSLALGIASQRSSFLLLERKTLKPLSPIISWQDLRGQKIIDNLKDQADIVYRKTGLALNPNYSLAKVLWLLKENPSLSPRLGTGEIVFAPLPTFIVLRLDPGRSFAADPTIAQRSLLFNIGDGVWDDELLRMFNLPKAMLPQIKNTIDDFGVTDSKFFGKEIPIKAMIGDQQSALIALGQEAQNHGLLNLGTGIFFLIPTGQNLTFIPGLSTSILIAQKNTRRFALEGLIATKDTANNAFASKEFGQIAASLLKQNLYPKVLSAAGGRSKNKSIIQNLANNLKCGIQVLSDLDLTALGAARLASGNLSANPPPVEETVLPQ